MEYIIYTFLMLLGFGLFLYSLKEDIKEYEEWRPVENNYFRKKSKS